MVFWLLAGAMTIAATLAAAIPLLWGRGRPESALAHDKEIYRARLDEIDADLALGRIARPEADAAKAEEGRRLLAASASEPGKAEASPRLARAVALFAVVAIPLGSMLAYLSWGNPQMPDMAIAKRQDVDPAHQSIEQLIQRAEARLASHPEDIRGWVVVAPIYLRLGRFDDAVIAWRNAVRLAPTDPNYKISLAEAITAASAGVVTDEARSLLQQALAERPGDARARFYLAIALSQQGSLPEAEAAWRALISDAPAEAPWLPVAKAQLAEVLQKAGKPAEPENVASAQGDADAAAQPGPTAQDIAAASSMSADDRQAMIEGMVARLADKLKENPDDKPGWLRLIRAYGVLGKRDEALGAIADARTRFASDGAFLTELTAAEQSIPQQGANQ